METKKVIIDGIEYIPKEDTKKIEDYSEYEFLNGNGEWSKINILFDKVEVYMKSLKELNYNFSGSYTYYTSKTDIHGFDVIWRKRK
jgi:hypothetical protein